LIEASSITSTARTLLIVVAEVACAVTKPF